MPGPELWGRDGEHIQDRARRRNEVRISLHTLLVNFASCKFHFSIKFLKGSQHKNSPNYKDFVWTSV